MKIIFNELGVITSTITDDEVYRQGNVGNIIEAVFEDKDSNDYIASFAYTRSDGSTLGQMPMSISGDNSYKFTFNDSWFMELDGITTLTIYLHDSKGNVVANGQVQFNIEKTDYNEITNVTPDELNAWIQALAEIKSYVDVVAEYSTYDNFPTTGETGKIYVDLSTNDIYRWSDSQYIALNSRSVEELEKVIPTDIVAEDNSLKLYHDSTEITGQTSPVTFKTINGSSIIGSGDIEIEGGAGGFVYEMDYAETGTIPLDIVEKLKDANSTIVKRLSFGEGQYFWFYFKLNMSGSDSSTSVLLYQCVTPFLGVNLVSMQIDISTGEFGLVSDSISYDDEPIKLRIDTLETEVNNINNEKGGWYTYSIALTSTTGTLTSSQLTTIKNYPAQTIIYYADHAHRLVKETDTQLIFASVNDYIEYWEITITKSGGGYIVSEIALAQNNAFLEVATQVEELENHKPYIIELSSDSGKLTEEQITRIQEYPYDTYFHFSENYYYYSAQLSTGSTYYFSALMLGQNVSYLVITIASKSYQRILTQLATSASLSTVTSRVSTLETTIKTKADTDDIPDVSEFITKSVSDLVNYYTKTQVDSQVSSLEAKISAIPKFAISVVTSLPTSGISETTIYLLKSSETETQNLYTEYIYINNAWEKLGTQKIDLTGYATETWVNNQISDFLTSTQINSLLSSYAKTSSLSTIATSGKLSDATTDSTHRVVTDTEKTTWNSKQDKLTFDTTPTSGSSNPVTSGGLYTKFDTYDSKISTLQNSDTFIYEFTYTGSSVTVDSTTLDKIRAKPQNAYIRAILKDNTYLLFHFVGYVSETNEVMVFSCFENETSYSATINNGTLSIATISLASNTQVNNLGAEVENLLDETPYSITISMGGGTIASTDLAHLIEHPYSTYLVETDSKFVFHIEVNVIEIANSCLFVNYNGSSTSIRVAIDTTTGGYTVNNERLALYSELSGTGVTYNLALTAQTGTLTSSQVTSLKNKHATITYNDSVYRFYELNSTYLIYSRDIITNTASYISIKLSDNSYAVANTTLADSDYVDNAINQALGYPIEQIVKVDKTSITETSNNTENNLASGTAGVSTGIIDNSNPYFNSNVYLPNGIYIELPEGAYQLERYYASTSGVEPSNIKVSFFNENKLVVTADDHSGIPDTTKTNATTDEGYISTIISVPEDAKYFSYQLGRNTDLIKIHKIIFYCKQMVSSGERVSISIKEIDSSLDSVDIIPPYEDRVDGYMLDLKTGEPVEKTSYTYLNKFFALADGAKYLFTTYLVGQIKDWSSYAVPYIYYYDADKTLISCDQFRFNAESPAYYKGISGSLSEIPEGAKYFRYSASIYTYNVVRFAVLIGEKSKMGDSTALYLGDNRTSSPLWKKQIVCFGDSITGSYVETDDSFKSYAAFLMEMTGATVHNVGFGGCLLTDRNSQYWGAFSMTAIVDAIVAEDFSAQQNALELIETDNQTSGYSLEFYKEHVANLKSIDWTTVDYVTIFYGTNDWASGIAIEPSGEDEFERTSIKGAYRYIVKQLQTKYPHLQITLLSVIPRFQAPTQNDDFTYSFEYMADVKGVSLEDYRNATEEIAKELHTGFIDMYNCGINKYNATYYFANNKDGTHPISYGRELIARRIAGYLTMRF